MLEMVLWTFIMGASCYDFCSMRNTGRHLDGHGIACPAAQGQQENHQGKYQMAHGVMIVGVKKSSTLLGKFQQCYYIYNSSMRL